VVINTGDVTIDNNDIFGEAVNVTARMEGLHCFPGGTIGISESTYLLMNRNEIIADLIGPQQLKGIPIPINVFHVPLEKQKLNAIPTRLLDLVEMVVQTQQSESIDFDKEINSFLEKNKIEGVQTVQKPETPKQAMSEPSKNELESFLKSPQPPIPIRFKSFVLDLLIVILFSVILKANGGLFLVLYCSLMWWALGASVGQKVFKMSVITSDGRHPSFFHALVRGMFFLLTPIFFFLVFLGKGRTFHDLVTNTSVVFTPTLNPKEGISPDQSLADSSLAVRFKSFLIDFLIVFLFYAVFHAKGILLAVLYFSGLWYFRKATLGQMIFNLEIVNMSGKNLTFIQVFLRSLLVIVSPIFFFLVFLGERRLVQDLISNTRVVSRS
ncbi:RDD family protein, partial [bacterium]|nr:RDD family protein [bacterium]